MERNKLARQIIDTCLEMTRLGLNQGTAGNVSVRYQDGMLITPTGIPYEKLTESHIVFIDGNGKHEEGKLPSSEWRFHMAAYQSRPDANAVVHNHAVHCTAVSILNRPIPAIHYMIAAAGGNSILARLMRPLEHANFLNMLRWLSKIVRQLCYNIMGLSLVRRIWRKRYGWRMKLKCWHNFT